MGPSHQTSSMKEISKLIEGGPNKKKIKLI